MLYEKKSVQKNYFTFNALQVFAKFFARNPQAMPAGGTSELMNKKKEIEEKFIIEFIE